MNVQEFLSGIKTLCIAYSKEDFDKTKCEVWYGYFKNVDFEVFKKAIKMVTMKEKFFPSIATLLEYVNNIEYPKNNPEEEFEEVRKAIRRYGSYRVDEAINSLKEPTQRVVRKLGGFSKLCCLTSSELDWVRKDFIDIYKTQTESDEMIYNRNRIENTERKMLDE